MTVAPQARWLPHEEGHLLIAARSDRLHQPSSSNELVGERWRHRGKGREDHDGIVWRVLGKPLGAVANESVRR
jgi:hypothetical protein